MINVDHLKNNRLNRVYHLLGFPSGDYQFMRKENEFYVFAIPHKYNPETRVEVRLTQQQVERQVYEVTARLCQPENFRIDLNRLESFYYYK